MRRRNLHSIILSGHMTDIKQERMDTLFQRKDLPTRINSMSLKKLVLMYLITPGKASIHVFLPMVRLVPVKVIL